MIGTMPASFSARTQHIEVHKFRGGSIIGITIVALLIQAFLPVYFPRTHLLDLPLVITIYFAFSRRNPSTGLLLGMTIGLVQDSLGRSPLGLFGISKTLVGYLASSLGARIDVENPVSRFGLTILFFLIHQAAYVVIKHLLLSQPAEFFSLGVLVAAFINAILAVAIFPLLDRLRLPN
jgi:rod shape-determining protein MreD